MDKKKRRHQKIRLIIVEKEISNQFELQADLRSRDEEVTQATLSRDLFELGIIKIPGNQKMYRYALPQQRPENNNKNWHQFAMEFNNFVTRFEATNNLLVIKTLPGNASGVALAIDNLNLDGMLGSIAGDDTIVIIGRTTEDIEKIVQQFEKL